MSNTSTAIGVDLGATKIAIVLAKLSGKILFERKIPTNPQRGEAVVLDDIAQLVNEMAEIASQLGEQVTGLGIGSPGRCDAIKGIVYNAVNLNWKEVQLAQEVRSRIKVSFPVWIEKDGNASALGEYYFGAARGIDNFAYISIGSGLGGGIIVNGRLVSGANSYAAEIGHLSIDPSSAQLCSCGHYGCAETFVSGVGLVVVGNRTLKAGGLSTRLSTSTMTPTNILAAAHEDDPLAKAVLAEAGQALGTLAAVIVSLLNPSRLVIGGGLGLAAFNDWVPMIREELARRVQAASCSELDILPTQLDSSGLGPVGLVRYNMENEFGSSKEGGG